MVNKKTNKQFVLLLACLLSLPSPIHANPQPQPQPQQTSYLELAQAGTRIIATGVSVVLSYVLIKQMLGRPFAGCYHQDWTHQPSSSRLPLTTNQEEFLINLLSSMNQPENPHAVITGDAGSGKTTIVRTLAAKIANKDSMMDNTPFSEAVVWSVDADALNASGIMGQTTNRLKHVWSTASNYYKKTGKKVILFFDEFHRLMQIGNHSLSTAENLSEVLKTLTGNKADYCGVHIIGATTTKEYKIYVGNEDIESAITRRFPKYELPPMDKADALSLLKNNAWYCQKAQHVFISPKDLDSICATSVDSFKKNGQNYPNPDQLKKLFSSVIMKFANERRKTELNETKNLHEEISFLKRRICELKEKCAQTKNTWMDWCMKYLCAQPKITAKIHSSDISNRVKSTFRQESNQSARKHLCMILWDFDTNLEQNNTVTNTQKKHVRETIIWELQTTLDQKEARLTAIKKEREENKAKVSQYACLTGEIQRLTQQRDASSLICKSTMTSEKNIDRAIHHLEKQKQKLEKEIEAQSSSLRLQRKNVSRLLQKLNASADTDQSYLDIYA